VHTVPAGVDLGTFTTDIDRHAARQTLGGGRIILFVGRLQPLKAPDMAVRALAALDDLLPDDGLPTRLVIVGGSSGPSVPHTQPAGLRHLADHLGVGDRVAMLAPRPQHELAALYRAADAVIVPSHSESFGLVALEAQACGTPVVASDVGGLRSIIGSGGTLVAERTPQAFAAALAPYLTDGRLRAAAAQSARATAAAYSWGATADATLAIYDDVVAAARVGTFTSHARGA
jgi:D-inositol-3-phosphate glycosyltransferase